jgi:hypothetical protein
MKLRVPEIVLGVLLTVAVFAMGMLFSSQHPQQVVGINPKQGTAEGVQSRSDAQHATPGEVKPVSQPEQASRNSDTHEIYGVKPGEFLLFLATVGLWSATILLVWDARKTAERQLRAYVVIYGKGVRSKPGCFISDIEIKNVGQTPAYDVVAVVVTDILPFPLPKNFDFTLVSPDTPPSIGLLGPGQRTGMSPDLTKNDCVIEEWTEATTEAGHLRIYTFGTVTYRDAFSNKRHTNLCLYFQWDESSCATATYEAHNDAN